MFAPVHSGKKLDDWCESGVDREIKEGMEFLHPGSTRGGAPTLCFDGSKRKTKGNCWRARGRFNIEAAKTYM